tara:strand:- start:2125 stop:2271 length:147 start_codon:yes stop_codon:yes gene_type:complete
MGAFSEEELDFIIAACKQCLTKTEDNGVAANFLLDLMMKCKEIKKGLK